ncbi:MAG: ABC transporter permease [Planctomycetota bacterium]
MLLMLGIPLVEDAWKRSDRAVYVPLQGGALDWIFLRVDTGEVKRAADVVSSTLVARGRAPVTLHPLVLPFVLGGQIDRFEAVRTALFLACLVMGGVVMANIGLLASLERSTEIAIRRVEGATRADVALHFLLEGQVLAAVGSVLGCFLGMGLAALRVAFEPVTGFAWVFPWSQAGIAVGVALGIGVLASLLPALDAVRRPPAAVLADE